MICPYCSVEFTRSSNSQKFCCASHRWKARSAKPEESELRYKKREERREYLSEYKMKRGCEECGYKGHPAALTFDHIDPTTKTLTPAHLSGYCWEKLHEEIAKCRVLCANCHNIHSYNQRRATCNG